MSASTPSWLNDSFIVQVLETAESSREYMEVVSVASEPAVPLGSNFLSTLYRVHVDYRVGFAEELKSISLIAKIPFEKKDDCAQSFDGYEKELKFYNEILPLLTTSNGTQCCQVAPRSFHCNVDGSLILEDLKASGYKMADRLKQLDYPHCSEVLKTLARFHASSVACLHRHPRLARDVGSNYFFDHRASEEQQRQMRELNDRFLKAFIYTVEKLEGCQRYADMMWKMVDTSWAKVVQLYKSPSVLSCLIHGDPWLSNVLFKYDCHGRVIDAKLVDFQLLGFSSFVFDIIFFWWSSANEDVREHHKDDLFEEYRLTLNDTLRELKCRETLTKEEFDQEVKNYAPYSLVIISTILPNVLADPELLVDSGSPGWDAALTNDFDEHSETWKDFRSKYFRAVLPKMLRQLELFGVFE